MHLLRAGLFWQQRAAAIIVTYCIQRRFQVMASPGCLQNEDISVAD